MVSEGKGDQIQLLSALHAIKFSHIHRSDEVSNSMHHNKNYYALIFHLSHSSFNLRQKVMLKNSYRF